MGFSRKKNCTPPGFPVKFTATSLEFPIFCIDPLEIRVFSSIFGLPPGIPTTFILPTLEFPIDIFNKGGGLQFFFWKNPIPTWNESQLFKSSLTCPNNFQRTKNKPVEKE